MMQFPPFPYKVSLCFQPLADYIREKQNSSNKAIAALAKQVIEGLDKVPELLEPIKDMRVIDKNRELVEMMMGFVFSPAEIDREIIAAGTPFQMEAFFSSPLWVEMQVNNEEKVKHHLSLKEMHEMKILNANSLVLNHIYGQDSPDKFHTTFAIPHPETGLNRYYRVSIITEFARVVPIKEPKKLNDKDFRLLRNDLHNLKLWEAYLPYENFEIQGMVVVKLTDVTEQEIISSLKYDLLRKDSITSAEQFPILQQKFREIYGKPDLRLGVVLFDMDSKNQGNPGPKIWNSIIEKEEFESLKPEDFENCVYHKMMEMQSPLVIDDLKAYEKITKVEEIVINKGYRNLLLAPLEDDGKCLGSLELASTNLGDLSHSAVLILEEILPIFAVAARRSLDELNNEVQAHIKEDYTAIHPAVEWRFTEAATNKLNKERLGQPVENEPIIFRDVFPLYGLSDIRGSSTARSAAIQSDLLEQLQLAQDLLELAHAKKALPIVNEIIYQLNKYQKSISESMGSGDEQNVLFYLENTVEPLFRHFGKAALISPEESNLYFGQLDKELGILYKRRKAFEDSVTMINDAISKYLDEEQDKTQDLFPHYYERYKTDGVEYNMYVGQSLVQGQEYDPIYLRNLRLWQLSATSEITRISKNLKKSLPLPMDTAQLILVHSTSIAIRFREDEKQFDVDGAYNIRYEIVKKRIDKARIKGTRERLTQPGKIAIVYSQDREAIEYYDYIEYLQDQGVLESNVEQLELEALQGANGLKALRVTVVQEEKTSKKVTKKAKVAEHV